MSLITRCPACETLFRVVPDQLRISEGWVRCGQCGEIFDASQQLQALPVAQPPAPVFVPPPAVQPPATVATTMAQPAGLPAPASPSLAPSVQPVPPVTPEPLEPAQSAEDHFPDTLVAVEDTPPPATPRQGLAGPGAPVHGDIPVQGLDPADGWPAAPDGDLAASDGTPRPAPPPDAPQPPAPEDGPGDQGQPHTLDDPDMAASPVGVTQGDGEEEPVQDAPPEPPEEFTEPHVAQAADVAGKASHDSVAQDPPDAPGRAPFPSLRLPAEPVLIPPDAASAGLELSDTDAPPSFMRQRRAPSTWWQGAAVRATLGTLAGLLMVTLALQVLLQQRDRIAALAPDTRPMLAGLCGWLGCTVSPLRQIESIVIDGSSFGRIRDNHYRLTIGIRNTAVLPLSMPALELSLTNSQAQTLARRVIQPHEFNGAPQVLEPGAEWNGALTLRIAQGTSAQDVAGYGLFAFYP